MTLTDIWCWITGIWPTFWNWVSCMTVDDFNKIALALVALIALFLGPWMQWLIAKRQVQMQAEIANRQIETQSRIATRQIADNISSKRQNWIDELRKDAAEFLTVVSRIQELKRTRVEQIIAMTDIANDFKERLSAEMRAKELGTRIKLRLNPNEAVHNRLIELISEMTSKGHELNRRYTAEEEAQVARIFNEANNAVVEHLQIILKYEWERVKKGDV
jgi:type II secretory pathway pseudopilin PulG